MSTSTVVTEEKAGRTNAASPSSRASSVSGLRASLFILAVAASGFLVPALIHSQLALTLLTQAVIYAVLATAIGFMIRQNGLTSFGHAAFFGLAAYTMALSGKYDLMAPEVAILAAIALPSALAFVAGLVIVRLPALAFSMLTLAVAQAFHELFLRWREIAGGDDGMPVRLPSSLFGLDISHFQMPAHMFVICWIVLVFVIGGLWLLARSRFGVLTHAIRENEERARYIGYETLIPRALIFALSAAVGALAGVLFVIYNAFVTPGVLHWSLSGEALIMAIIGGTQAIWGPALGAIIFFMLKDASSDLTEHWPAIMGITLILVTVLLPHGTSGLLVSLARKFRGGSK